MALYIALAVAILTAACSKPAASPIPEPDAASPTTEAATQEPAPQRLELAYEKPAKVGTAVIATATGLPAGREVDLQWSTVTGGWVIEDYYHFKGKKYNESVSSLGKFQVDQNGRLEAKFAIPEDYGGVHDIMATVDGKTVAQNGVEVTQTFELSPLSGPVGTVMELTVKGLGGRTMESTWVVNWDNNEIGWVSAASSKGSAVARFRASGAPGDHVVKLLSGYQGQGYLNHEQAPNAYLPRPQFTFRMTPGRASMASAYAEPYQKQPIPKPEISVANATIGMTPTQGPGGTRATLKGTGFPGGSSLSLVWQTYVGSRVSGNGFSPQEADLQPVKVGADGSINVPVTIPDDLGGLHGLALRDGEKTLAVTHFVIETSIVSITPSSGPVGTPVSIHVKGVGWTEYDNLYAATYDNAYMGYVCGFNSAGDVVINFTAAGEPGVHLIDLYPGIYQGPPTEPQRLYLTPQLTYRDDHPGNKIPALRFAFEVTSSTPPARLLTSR